MSGRKRYIQGAGGNKLTMKVALSTLDDSKTISTTALLDCGCTGSTIHTQFVKKNKLPTTQLPRPIPVYSADGMLNRNGRIMEMVTMQMVIQDHEEEITFAVSDIGSTDVYIGHEWLKRHNPNIAWEKPRVFMNRCPIMLNSMPRCQACIFAFFSISFRFHLFSLIFCLSVRFWSFFTQLYRHLIASHVLIILQTHDDRYNFKRHSRRHLRPFSPYIR
jgi:hypothetical protein